MFIAVIFIIARSWTHPSWYKKRLEIENVQFHYTMEYDLAIKTEDIKNVAGR